MRSFFSTQAATCKRRRFSLEYVHACCYRAFTANRRPRLSFVWNEIDERRRSKKRRRALATRSFRNDRKPLQGPFDRPFHNDGNPVVRRHNGDGRNIRKRRPFDIAAIGRSDFWRQHRNYNNGVDSFNFWIQL